MSADAVRRIADAVLYEGYLLWPYRKSALKNQQRFTFGGVHPPAWDDRSSLQTQVLLEGEDAGVEVRVRFLHVIRRQVLRISASSGVPEPVEELESDGERWISWEETTERELTPGAVRVPAGEDIEEIPGGIIRRSWAALQGEVTVTREVLHPALCRVTVRVENTTPCRPRTRADALRHAFSSTHVVLRTPDGAWVSATDPPEALGAEARACVSSGVWPILAGAAGDRSTVLASPIILADHPEIAPESPGDLFDSGEIDQMLVLNILAMTDEERRDMRDADPRAREILERTEALSQDDIMRLHGAVRDFGLTRSR
jgi:hypothetical protein